VVWPRIFEFFNRQGQAPLPLASDRPFRSPRNQTRSMI
jgi:hypothetical protein